MKIKGRCNAKWIPERKAILLVPLESDAPIIEKLFARKKSQEEKEGSTVYPSYTLEVAARDRTFKQNSAVWALITVIFRSMHGRKPSEQEKYDLYLDCLELYAEKVPNRFTGALRAVHLSESDVYQAARLIGHLMDVLVEYCDLDAMDESGKPIGTDLQADVRMIFERWHSWRGCLAIDPLDYDEDGNPLSPVEWRKRHKVSDASGVGGFLEVAHIVSRGADAGAIDEPWNRLALLPEEHRFQHQHGWTPFLERYPHLRSRVLRARSLAGES